LMKKMKTLFDYLHGCDCSSDDEDGIGPPRRKQTQ
jgi:hypothetical protein